MASIAKKAFFGGAVHKVIPTSNTPLPSHVRVYRLNPSSGNGNVVLQEAFSRSGGPQCYLINESASNSITVKDPAEAAIGVIPTEGVGIVFKLGNSWKLKVTGSSAWQASAPVTAPPERMSLTLGPGTLFDLDLRDEAINKLGYDGVSPIDLTVTFVQGSFVYSTSTSSPAIDTGSFPSGSSLTLINKGIIFGCGGDGGTPAATAGAAKGGDGGAAILLQVPTQIDNSLGQIYGGGGGGGAPYSADSVVRDRSGGGGGGAGFHNGAGGAAGASNNNDGRPGTTSFPGFGGAGDMSVSTTGHNGISSLTSCLFNPRSGGMGGFPGMPGQCFDGHSASDYTGGAPGAAVLGAEFLTWIDRGAVQGYTSDLVSDIWEILIAIVAAPFKVTEYLEKAGWNGTDPVTVTVRVLDKAAMYNPRLHLWEANDSQKFFDATLFLDALPGGSSMTLINQGTIYGAPGWGGRGGRSDDVGIIHAPLDGEDGHTALKVSQAGTVVDNLGGSIRGGGSGGGGGPGGATLGSGADGKHGGAGGAGQGHPPSVLMRPHATAPIVDGVGGTHLGLDPDGVSLGFDPSYILPGSDITVTQSRETSPGSGAQGFEGISTLIDRYGGDGGVWGAQGTEASGSDNEGQPYAQPGAAGKAVDGNGNVTWTNTGERLGALL